MKFSLVCVLFVIICSISFGSLINNFDLRQRFMYRHLMLVNGSVVDDCEIDVLRRGDEDNCNIDGGVS